MSRVVINGAIIPAENASLHISDLAIQRGFGLFDFFKTINGRALFMDDHLERFFGSCNNMRLDPGYTEPQLKNLLEELMQVNKMQTSGIKIILTGGNSPDGYTPGVPNLIISQQPLVLNNEALPVPLKLVTYQHQRQLWHIKTLDYLVAIWLQPHIKESNADDVLYYTANGITECPRANIFVVDENNVLATPASGMLNGIVRKKVLEHFSTEFKIVERDIKLEELMGAREVFVTSSTKNIYPVGSIDGQKIGSGAAGPVTLNLRKKFLDLLYSAKN